MKLSGRSPIVGSSSSVQLPSELAVSSSLSSRRSSSSESESVARECRECDRLRLRVGGGVGSECMDAAELLRLRGPRWVGDGSSTGVQSRWGVERGIVVSLALWCVCV